LFLGFRYQNYTGKAIFMPPSIGVGIGYSSGICADGIGDGCHTVIWARIY
jgi:hypothetical protein